METQNHFGLQKDHDALLVADLQVSLQFYRDILGFKEIYNAGLGEKFKWVKASNDVQIHLIESNEKTEKNKGVHLAFNTSNLFGFIEFLRKQNVAFENSAGIADTTNTRPDGVEQIYFKDPDGYWIEVNNSKLEDF
ncbi:VOC family protein [Zunongwangia atlantica]|uniref:Glyoxalase/bleomycin resistance protein/dioxygenase n=1 Tax=Zunongwangia atlantica 22II14-10F7 TaxID=1185767 RepID=A0A1Y1T2U3_9FLAO|nr:VOC family protein [Zunongwangia atlantica]ORL45347.1 Glyoxalase/bleomycin resistance protein/dioxygenase [Zunongwangia atlantica 22II14-10F7]